MKAAGVGALASPAVFGSSGLSGVTEVKRPRNLIFLVADGMNMGTLSLAEHHCRMRRNGSCEWLKLYQQPRPFCRSLMETSSASSLVTDSAAAGSAWSCGQKIPNGKLNETESGEKLTPLFRHAMEAGKRCGLVTTTRITHATPASFAVSHPDRNDEDVIAEKLFDSGVEVLMGGGLRHFSPEAREDGKDLVQRFRAAGYKFSSDRNGMSADVGPKFLGLFDESHLPYSIDRDASMDIAAKVPTLASMTSRALELLAGSPQGFCLQVEGGRIDHAGHANDAAAILQDQLAFDASIQVVAEFLERSPDTLLIVTTDHGTGGCQLNGVGRGYNGTNGAFSKIAGKRMSFEKISKQLDPDVGLSVKERLAVVRNGLGLPISRDQLELFQEKLSESFYAFCGAVSPLVRDETGIGFTSHNHTGDHVEFFATGPGHDVFPASFENAQIQGWLREVLAI